MAEPQTAAADLALRGDNIVKRFGAVTALDGVSLTLGKGEILGILGDNGAGKSTLVKILTGFHQQTDGTLHVHGEETLLKSVDHARSLGIECVYQDLALANSLSIYHNMFLNREIVRRGPFRLVDHKKMREAPFTPSDAKNPTPPEAALVDVQTAFRQLQADRHRADYDLSWNIVETDVTTSITLVEGAFAKWRSIRAEEFARHYLLSMFGANR